MKQGAWWQRHLRESRNWWVFGALASVVFPIAVLLQTPVRYQASLRVEPAERSVEPAREELLLSSSSARTLRRVHQRLLESTSLSLQLKARDLEPVLLRQSRVAIGDADYRVVKSNDGAFVIVRSPRSVEAGELALIVARSLMDSVAERRHELLVEERVALVARIAEVEPRVSVQRGAKISEYETVIKDLGARLELLWPGKVQTLESERLQIELRAAVLQQTELRNGLPLSGANVEQRLLGVDGKRLFADSRRLAELDREVREQPTRWRVAEELLGPPQRVRRSLLIPMFAAFLFPLVLVGVARLLIESV